MGVFQSERFALKLHRTQTNNNGLTKNRQPHKAVKQHLLGLPLNDFKQNIKHRSVRISFQHVRNKYINQLEPF